MHHEWSEVVVEDVARIVALAIDVGNIVVGDKGRVDGDGRFIDRSVGGNRGFR